MLTSFGGAGSEIYAPRGPHQDFELAIMPSSQGLDERAQVGFSKSSAYDQHRPAYSLTIVQLLLEKLRLAGRNGAKILDLAAGTGKFTEALTARGEKYHIVAVEPHDGMRQVLEGKKLPGVTVKDGTASSIPLEDGSVDAVICAQVGNTFTVSLALSCQLSFSQVISSQIGGHELSSS